MEIYTEKHFLRKRDVPAYKHKQAQSCKWLVPRLREWHDETTDPFVRMVTLHLASVHAQQLVDICIVTNIESEYVPTMADSFYFHHMYRFSDGDFSRVAVHAVSYMRGAQRYTQLIEAHNEALWSILWRDASLNMGLCLSCMETMKGEVEAQKELDRIIEFEAHLMKEIDARNAGK